MFDLELIKNRHSVRKYKDIPLTDEHITKINELLAEINKNDLSFKLITNENIFKNIILGYGFIKNCNNYIVLGGMDSELLEEKVGYYGEELVLKLLELGINSCFVGGTYKSTYIRTVQFYVNQYLTDCVIYRRKRLSAFISNP